VPLGKGKAPQLRKGVEKRRAVLLPVLNRVEERRGKKSRSYFAVEGSDAANQRKGRNAISLSRGATRKFTPREKYQNKI